MMMNPNPVTLGIAKGFSDLIYNEAKKNYNIVANQYPNSSKAPRALYQLYSIAKDVDKNTASANQYKNKLLTQYPKSEEVKFFKK